jgi:hypothetical protein
MMIVVDTSSGLQPVCDKHNIMRCNSRQAAELIQNRTIDDGSLLIITCDASGRGGGSKHDGIASILRLRHGVVLSADKQHHHDEEKEDLIDSVSRRTVPSRTSSEVAAIALGVKHAIKTVPSSLRNKILILSDSEFALDFYCSEKAISSLQTRNHNNQLQPQNINKRRKNSSSSKRRGKRQAPTRSTKLREEAYWRLFATLLDETPDGVVLSKVKSSSRSVGLSSSRVSSLEDEDGNTSWDGKGFLDHDAADHLSSNARYVSNNNDCYTPFRAVRSLGIDDLKWLAYSEEDKDDDAGIWNEIIVKGNDAREDRRKRKQLRIDRILELL